MKVTVEGLDTLEKYLTTQIPEEIDRAMQQATERTAVDLQRSLASAVGKFDGNVGWTGYLYNSIRAFNPNVHGWKGKENVWEVHMLAYGRDLDSTPAHYETLKRGNKITTWAKAHNIKANRLVVKPHPFIDEGIEGAEYHVQVALNQIGD